MTEEKRKDNAPSVTWAAIKTEFKAVCALESYLLKSDFLLPLVSRNDRDISWDGKINLFANPQMRARDFIGSASIQVKGQRVRQFPKEGSTPSFQLRVDDLRNYQNNGGAILFNVRFVGDDFRIYYALLFPSLIKKRLRQKPNAKSFAIKLKEYSEDPGIQKRLIEYFLEHSSKQALFYSRFASEFDANEILKNGEYNIELRWFGKNQGAAFPYFAEDVLVYAVDKSTGLWIPRDELECVSVTTHWTSAITVGEEEFFSSFALKETRDEQEYFIGNKQIRFKNGSLNADFDGPLAQSILTLRFIIAFFENGGFTLGRHLKGQLNRVEGREEEIARLRQDLEIRERAAQLFNALGLDVNADTTKFTSETWYSIDVLATALIDRRPVFGLKPEPQGAAVPVCFELIGQEIALRAEPTEESGYYRLFDLFAPDSNVVRAAAFFLQLKKDFWVRCANFNCDTLVSAFHEASLPTIADNVNNLLLELLLAFDECQKLGDEARAEALLKAAQRLNEWTLAQDKFNAIYQLNRLQIIKRQRALNPEEEALALEIFDAACDSIAHLTRIVASALLDDKARVRKCWRDLSPAEKRDFRGWPISRFVDVKELPLEVDDAETN